MRPQARRTKPGFLLLLCFALGVSAIACTGSSLRGSSSGWSPVAAIMIPNDTGGRLVEGSILSPQDNTLTVDNPRDFVPGQVILIDEEQILVAAIEDGYLIVERGFNNTRRRTHPDRSPIFTLGDQATVFISTKEGEVKVLDDDGTGVPSLRWSYLPPERD